MVSWEKCDNIIDARKLEKKLKSYLASARYILRSQATGKYYLGSTNNLQQRLKQHRSGYTRTTKVLAAYDLVYTEKYDNITDARSREKKLKSFKSHKYIDWLISQAGPVAQPAEQ